MERLTSRDDEGNVCRTSSAVSNSDAWNRLADFEDTGLEPEDINTIKAVYVPDHEELKAYRELGSIGRLRDLAEAAKDGRCVVLPCKVGDTVWAVIPADCKDGSCPDCDTEMCIYDRFHMPPYDALLDCKNDHAKIKNMEVGTISVEITDEGCEIIVDDYAPAEDCYATRTDADEALEVEK